jgi:hypothetical protein
MIGCSDLVAMKKILGDLWGEPAEALAIAIGALRESYGRVALSRLTGLTERRVRSIKESLEKKCLNQSKECAQSLMITLNKLKVTRTRIDDKTLICIHPLHDELLSIAESRIVYLRDLVVIQLRTPGSLEIIGLKINNEYRIPGLPQQLSEQYINKVSSTAVPDNSLFTLWSNYKELIGEAALINALAILCEQLRM